MKASIAILLALFLYDSLNHSQALTGPRLNNSTDFDALLSFKSHITHDPYGILHTWNPNTSFCNWEGVLCNPSKQRVTGLALGNLTLAGTITPLITNLSFLRLIDLQNNSFSGYLPTDLGKLFRLETLVLASNVIHGTIPSSLSLCSKLRLLDLSDNQFHGSIPPELGMLSNLRDLSFAKNNLTGSIPSSFGNLSSLNNLIFLSNNLQGFIPNELGQLRFLLQLSLADNNLSGEIPTSLYNLSSLIIMSLAKNRFSGHLSSNLFSTLPNLDTLFVGGNLLQGPIPASLSNASSLKRLDLSSNQFTGQVPLLWNLPNLLILNLEINGLVSNGENGLDFITSLQNSTLLQVFSVATNQLTGPIPSSIGNLSTQLSLLVMGENHLQGNIPKEIGNLHSLIMLSTESNSLTGNIPSTIGNLQNLQQLFLEMNSLSGPIPESLQNLTGLYELGLSRNKLTGRIPSSLSNCQHLQTLDLSHNELKGEIPKEIFGYPSLGFLLNLSWNSLTGSLPSEIGNLKMVQGIDISKNKLSGTIPTTIGQCSNLLYLDLSNNSFLGSIPDSMANLKGIEYLDLSSNNLSGSIPLSLASLQFLQNLNLSGNHLQGKVPTRGIFLNSTAISTTGNSELCGGAPILGLPDCVVTEMHSNRWKTKLVVGLAMGSAGLFILMALGFFLLLYRKRKPELKSTDAEIISFEDPHRLYTYYDLRAATSNFDSENLIGEGSFGSVYKGVLSDGTPVAIKVFNMDQHGASKSFLAECEALRNVRHRNLVRIMSACSTNDFKALVLQLMSSGSLEEWLHHTRGWGIERRSLNIQQRLEIAIEVAAAMEYLHHDCEVPVVHCDLKPSNVLMNENMTAHVGDFGLAKMLHGTASNHQQSSSTIGLRGSIGYIAPEYGLGGTVSTKGDVYSYGMLLLELFTGKRPTNEMFSGGLKFQEWVRTAFPEQVVEILDVELVEDCNLWNKDCLVSVINIGLSCASEIPEERPNMRDVSAMIKRTRNLLTNSNNKI
ncbi:PREDICTED: probable LRR receptor-like serine/threonine-protein kinase At3g47570 [Nelumbo nucifera]|uniref:non-specific serine/threonine protein kinase n=2 Tax=Nelumbo nucifera TaxID=4432 RepID=A0A1U8A6T3_NELNU|nr:PREDICTED: probable LRR receptor-like serine/threonine-protein kinase At3g47570 [Nelumbo nucifera]DAD26504.1 TPA_asm: hypothetical protein HUJ06_027972 [Nelumbo nucifera]